MSDPTIQLLDQLLGQLADAADQQAIANAARTAEEAISNAARAAEQAAADKLLPWACDVNGTLITDAIAKGWMAEGAATIRAWHGNGFRAHTADALDVWTRPCCDCEQDLVLLAKPGRRFTRADGPRRCHGCQAIAERASWAKAKRKQRAAVAPDPSTVCEHCGESFIRKRSTARYCSTRCRVAAHRAQAVPSVGAST